MSRASTTKSTREFSGTKKATTTTTVQSQTPFSTVRQAPMRPASRPNSRAPEEGHELHEQEDAEHGALGEAELLLPVDARAADDGLDAVVEEEVRDEEEQGLRVVAQVTQGGAQLLDAAAHDACRAGNRGLDGSGEVAQPEIGDERENRPTTARRTGC